MEFEHGAGVIVEPAHDPGVDDVRDPGAVKEPTDGGKVLGVLALEPVEDRRRLRHHRGSPLVLGVEGSQRVLVDPLTHVVR